MKLWPQRNDGGDLWIAPKSATSVRVDLVGYTLANIRHARYLWRGTLEGNARLLKRHARVTDIGSACAADRLAYTITW